MQRKHISGSRLPRSLDLGPCANYFVTSFLFTVGDPIWCLFACLSCALVGGNYRSCFGTPQRNRVAEIVIYKLKTWKTNSTQSNYEMTIASE